MLQQHSAKQRIIEAAAYVFYKQGYRATGVSTIAKAAHITKATLYHHFQDKDALIEHALSYLSECHRSNYMKAWNKKGLKPIDKLTVLFDEMHASFKKPDCYGCPFINASSEYTDLEHPVRKISQAHYQFLTHHLEQFARDAHLRKPRLLAETIAGLIAGAYTGWFVGGIEHAATQAKNIATMLIVKHSKDVPR